MDRPTDHTDARTDRLTERTVSSSVSFSFLLLPPPLCLLLLILFLFLHLVFLLPRLPPFTSLLLLLYLLPLSPITPVLLLSILPPHLSLLLHFLLLSLPCPPPLFFLISYSSFLLQLLFISRSIFIRIREYEYTLLLKQYCFPRLLGNEGAKHI